MTRMTFCPSLKPLACAILLATAPLPLAAAAAGLTAGQQYDIAAGTLDQALSRFAAQAGLLLAIDGSLTAGKASAGLQGRYSVEQGLDRLLAGSGLSAVKKADGSYALERTPAPETTLKTVKVSDTLEETARGPVMGYAATRSATGTKTDTPILETPQSITVIGEEEMETRRVTGIGDALNYVAGVVSTPTAAEHSSDQAMLRGFRADSSSFYKDGKKFSQNLYYDGQQEPYACERIEVLKGAASLLYGMAEPGGVINCVSKAPTTAPVRKLNLEYGSFNRKQISGDFGDALSADGNWSYRLTFLGRDSDSMVKHTPDDRRFIAAAVRWEPSAATSLELRADYLHSRTSHGSYLPAEGTLLPNVNGRIAQDYYNGWPGRDIFTSTARSAGYRFEHAFADSVSLHHTATYFDRAVDNPMFSWGNISADQLSSLEGWTGGLKWREKSHSVATDTYVEANIDTGPVAHKLIGGADTLDQWWKSRRSSWDSSATFSWFDPQYGQIFQGELVPWTYFPDFMERTTGAYVQDQMKIADRWVLLLGLRHDWDTAKSSYTQTTGEHVTERTQATTRKAGAVYLGDHGLAPFISFSQSFVPTSGEDRSGSRFKPTQGEQYEAGIRWQPPGTAAILSAAAYQLTKKNITVSDPVDPDFSVQLGEVRSRGLELEARGEVVRGTNVIAAYTYTDAKTIESSPLTPDDLGRMGGVPRNTAALWINQDFGLFGATGFKLGFGVRYLDSYPALWDTTLVNRSLTLVDGMASYTTGPWRYALNISNLTDKRYATCANDCTWGESRNAIASASYLW
jgi:iron complex outermembrane receptor protein